MNRHKLFHLNIAIIDLFKTFLQLSLFTSIRIYRHCQTVLASPNIFVLKPILIFIFCTLVLRPWMFKTNSK